MNQQMFNRRRVLAFGAAGLASLVAGSVASAAEAGYPTKPIRLVVGYPPGGGADILARIIAPRLAAIVAQGIVVENKAGAGQNIGASVVAHSAPDGYTLLFSSSALTVNGSLYRNLNYDPKYDFTPVALVGRAPNLLVTRADSDLKSYADLVARAKSAPGNLNFSSSGAGSTQHLAGELLNKRAQISTIHVPYKGTAPSMTAILAGEADFSFVNVQSAKPFVEDGRMRALAITSTERSPLFPKVPTMEELGQNNFDVSAWYGLLAPAHTPIGIVETLNKAVNQVISQPDVRQQMISSGIDVRPATREQFNELLQREYAQWAQLIKATGIKLD